MEMATSWSENGMTGSGRVAAVGTFGKVQIREYQQVRGVDGGTGSQITVRHGRVPGGAIIASLDAAVGAEIDLRDAPVRCPDGIYLEVAGDPARIDVRVLWK